MQMREIAERACNQFGIPPNAFDFRWHEFTDEVLDHAEREFRLTDPFVLSYPWTSLGVCRPGGELFDTIRVPRYAVVRRALRQKRVEPWMHCSNTDDGLYIAYTVALMNLVFGGAQPVAAPMYLRHGSWFYAVMPEDFNRMPVHYDNDPPTRFAQLHVAYPISSTVPTLSFDSADVEGGNSGNYDTKIRWPWFLVNFDDQLAWWSASLHGATWKEFEAQQSAARDSDPSEVIEFGGVSAPRWSHVRDALRAADEAALCQLGYDPGHYIRYRDALYAHMNAAENSGVVLHGRRLVPHPNACSPKAVGFLRDVGGYRSECPRVLFRPSGEEDGVNYEAYSTPRMGFNLAPKDKQGHDFCGSFVVPWWMVDFVEETPDLRRERLRQKARVRLASKIEWWGPRSIRPRSTLTQVKGDGYKIGATSRGVRIATGAAFKWAREQRDWPACAAHMVVLEYNSNVRSTDRLVTRTAKAAARFVKEKFGYDSRGHDYSVFNRITAGKDEGRIEIKQENDTPWHKQTAQLPWNNEAWAWVAVNPMARLHAAQPAKDDPMKVSFYKSFDDWLNAKRTVMKPGRYLQKYYGLKSPDACIPWLDENEVRVWAELWEEAFRPVEVHFKENTDPDGWEWVYRNETGFDSCMSAHKYGGNGPKAVRAYAHPENTLALAYLLNKTGEAVTARCIVNKEKMVAGRVYGDSRLRNALTTRGYSVEVGGLVGQKLALNRDPCNPAMAYMPYLDYGTAAGGGATNIVLAADGSHFVVTTGEEGYRAADYGSAQVYLPDVIRRTPWSVTVEGIDGARPTPDEDDEYAVTCGHCNALVHIDDTAYSEYHDRHICSGCFDSYVTAYVNRSNRDYVEECDTVYFDGEYYLDDSDVLDYHGLRRCDYSDEIGWVDGMVVLPNGDMVLPQCAVELAVPHEDDYGNTYYYAYEDETVNTTDGQVIYEDDAQELDDGRVFHKDNVIEWSDGSLHHESEEEPEGDAGDVPPPAVEQPSQHDTAYVIAA